MGGFLGDKNLSIIIFFTEMECEYFSKEYQVLRLIIMRCKNVYP